MAHKLAREEVKPRKLKFATHTPPVGIPIWVLFTTTPGRWALDATSEQPEFVFSMGRGSYKKSLFPDAWRGKDGSLLISDVWKVRDVFLDLKSDSDFLGFLDELGSFLPASHVATSGSRSTLDSFKMWQDLFREFLRRGPATWLDFVKAQRRTGTPNRPDVAVLVEASNFTMQFRWHRGDEPYGKHVSPYTAILKASDIASAILATIHVDRIRDAKFGFCARDDCRKPFEITSEHKRKYCEQYCGHLEAMRRQRRERKGKRKPRGQSAV
jgi:hypothetical protein